MVSFIASCARMLALLTAALLRAQGIVFNAVVYVSGYIFLLFVTVCLGSPRPAPSRFACLAG